MMPTVAFVLSRLREWGISMIRTQVAPALAGWVLLQLVRLGVSVDAASLQVVLVAVLSAVWYGVCRWVELASRSRQVARLAGWLLGSPSAPAVRLVPGELRARAVR